MLFKHEHELVIAESPAGSMKVLPEVNIITASIRLFSASEAIKQSPKEVDNVLVVSEQVSVNEPAVVGNNPTDPVWVEAVVQEVEDSIDTSLASTHYHVVRVALSYPGQTYKGGNKDGAYVE